MISEILAQTRVEAPGYLGLTQRSIEVDWKAVSDHGPCVIVAPRSPAWKGGLRCGDFIVSINGMNFDDFHSVLPTAGTPFTIVAWRQRVGEVTAFGRLGAPPKPPSETSSATPAKSPGRPVPKRERPLFVQGFISNNSDLKAIDIRLLIVLLNCEGVRGSFPKRATLAIRMHCSLSTVDRSNRRCQHAGVLRVESGRSRRRSNRYFVTWPLNHPKSVGWEG